MVPGTPISSAYAAFLLRRNEIVRLRVKKNELNIPENIPVLREIENENENEN